MTMKERHVPDIIKASRKKQIAAGSGTSVQEVNKFAETVRPHADRHEAHEQAWPERPHAQRPLNADAEGHGTTTPTMLITVRRKPHMGLKIRLARAGAEEASMLPHIVVADMPLARATGASSRNLARTAPDAARRARGSRRVCNRNEFQHWLKPWSARHRTGREIPRPCAKAGADAGVEGSSKVQSVPKKSAPGAFEGGRGRGGGLSCPLVPSCWVSSVARTACEASCG